MHCLTQLGQCRVSFLILLNFQLSDKCLRDFKSIFIFKDTGLKLQNLTLVHFSCVTIWRKRDNKDRTYNKVLPSDFFVSYLFSIEMFLKGSAYLNHEDFLGSVQM